jgi:hypothetical protein
MTEFNAYAIISHIEAGKCARVGFNYDGPHGDVEAMEYAIVEFLSQTARGVLARASTEHVFGPLWVTMVADTASETFLFDFHEDGAVEVVGAGE